MLVVNFHFSLSCFETHWLVAVGVGVAVSGLHSYGYEAARPFTWLRMTGPEENPRVLGKKCPSVVEMMSLCEFFRRLLQRGELDPTITLYGASVQNLRIHFVPLSTAVQCGACARYKTRDVALTRNPHTHATPLFCAFRGVRHKQFVDVDRCVD